MLTDEEGRILRAIPFGKENKIISDIIVKRAGFPETEWRTNKNLRHIIRILRFKGYAIVSNNRGYWRTKDHWEVCEYMKSLRQRADHIEETRLAMSHILEGWWKNDEQKS